MENDFKGRKCAGCRYCVHANRKKMKCYPNSKIVKKNMTWQKRISIKKPDVISFVIGKT